MPVRFPLQIIAVALCLGLMGACESPGDAQRPDAAGGESAESEQADTQQHTQVSTLNPAETVTAMLDAYLDNHLGEYYHHIAATDRAVKSLDSLQAEFAPGATDLVTDFLFSATRFSVDSVGVDGDTALVYLTSKAPPFRFVLEQAAVVERDLGNETDAETKLSIMTERDRLSGSPREENQSAYLVVREDRGWKVVVGWAEMEALMQAEPQDGGT